MNVVVGCDHAGLLLKLELLDLLKERKIDVRDVGTHTSDSVDYPDFALLVARAVAKGEADLGILVCGTGIGMSIVANKVRGVRAALCSTEYEARMARSHNHANVLCVGARVVGGGLARAMVETFINEPFAQGRHQLRVAKIQQAEDQG